MFLALIVLVETVLICAITEDSSLCERTLVVIYPGLFRISECSWLVSDECEYSDLAV